MSKLSLNKSVLVLFIIFVFALSNISFANTNPETLAMVFVKKILENEDSGNISKAIKYSKAFASWLNDQEPELAKKFQGANYNRLITLQAKTGNYEAAIATLNEKKAWDTSSVKESNFIFLHKKMKI